MSATKLGHVFFTPTDRLVFYVADRLRGSELRLREVFGDRGVSIDTSAPLPSWLEDLGHPGGIQPEGWMALRDGVLAASDYDGRVDAVRTARDRAREYGPVGVRRGDVDGCTMTSKVRSAEEIARETVSDPSRSQATGMWSVHIGNDVTWFCTAERADKQAALDDCRAARGTIASLVEQSRAEGAAAERVRAAEEAYAAQFYASPEEAAVAWTKFTGKPAPSQPRFCSCGRHSPLIHGTLCKCLDCGGFCDLAEPEPIASQEPRDLAGRIRALSTRWFNAWASLGNLDHQTDAALRQCLGVLREAERHARGCPDQRSASEIVTTLRDWAGAAYDVTRPVFARIADELEQIVRDCEEKRT